MQEFASQEFNKNLMKKLQQYQIDLQLTKAQLDTAVHERDRARSEADERTAAMRSVFEALVGSLRPYGFDRRKFLRLVRETAERVPAHGPQAIRHTIMLEESRKVLASGGHDR